MPNEDDNPDGVAEVVRIVDAFREGLRINFPITLNNHLTELDELQKLVDKCKEEGRFGPYVEQMLSLFEPLMHQMARENNMTLAEFGTKATPPGYKPVFKFAFEKEMEESELRRRT